MKKLLLLGALLLALSSTPAQGQQWVTANQATIAWDAVTDSIDGTPLPAGEKIRFIVYLSNADTDPNKTNPAEIATTEAKQHVVTLNVEGRFFVGVRSERFRIDNGAILSSSVIAWS